MNKKIAVAMICRDSAKTIKECIESFEKHVDFLSIVDTGSKDKTIPIIHKTCRKLRLAYKLTQFKWIDDFAAARNFSFAHVPADCEWVLWLDSDDEVYQPENMRRLANDLPDSVGAIWFSYHYAIDEFGNVTTEYIRERLLRRRYNWVWRSRLHETVQPLIQCQFVKTDEVIIRHNHTAGASRSERNFRILNLMHQEDPNDRRVWLYLAHQLFAAGQYVKATEWYLKFGSDIGAIPVERYQALCYASKALRNLGDKQAVEAALMAMELFPNYRDGYLELAHSYMMLGDPDKAIHWAKMSDVKDPVIQEPPNVIFINPLDYTFNKYLLFANCYITKGDLAQAKTYFQMAHNIRPAPEIQNNVTHIEGLEMRNRVDESMKVLAVHLANNRELVKLEHLRHVAPYWWRETQSYKELMAGVGKLCGDLKDQTEIVEDGNKAMVNLARTVDAKALMGKLDKYEQVTLVAPFPTPDNTTQVNVFCQGDIENLITMKEGRHIQNLQVEPSRIICAYDHKVPQSLSVRFYLGQGLETWNPETILKKGCGGSETAMAYLARELAKRDCQPIIYAMDNQVWDGVIYRRFENYHPALMSHLFISSRVPDAITDDIPAKQKWLWVHDISCFDRLTPDIAQKLDAIVCLSRWHVEHMKRAYPWLKDAEVMDYDENPKTYEDAWTPGVFHADASIARLPKLAIIGNGIDIERFTVPEPIIRNNHRFIWCSSPDRGLEELLGMWADIRQALPDAELKIYYGWEYYDSTLHITEQRERKARILEAIRQPGIEWRGRVGQVQLAREMMQAGVLLYPPHDFRETYGIAFLEAQAAGVIPFYRMNGALGETIGDRGIPIPLTEKSAGIIKMLTETLSDQARCAKMREVGRAYAEGRGWSRQADKLLSLYGSIEDAKGHNSG